MITKEQVEHLAKLTRIALSDEEKGLLQEDLVRILEYVKTLEAVDTSEVVPTAHAVEARNDTRPDIAEDEGAPEEVHERTDLIDAFPEKEGRHLKIKEILA